MCVLELELEFEFSSHKYQTDNISDKMDWL